MDDLVADHAAFVEEDDAVCQAVLGVGFVPMKFLSVAAEAFDLLQAVEEGMDGLCVEAGFAAEDGCGFAGEGAEGSECVGSGEL